VRGFSVEEEILMPNDRVVLSLHLAPEFFIVFEPVTHSATFLDVQGEPTSERRDLTLTFTRGGAGHAKHVLRPGPVRLTFENKSDRRLLPGVFRANHELHEMFKRRRTFLTAKDVLTNQTFRDLFKAEALEVDQRLKLASLTVLFTDLKGSTELYERVGDLVAYDMVQKHFGVLASVIHAHDGAVVKTIGDAVMATFPRPELGLSAALEMHSAMDQFNAGRKRDDLVVKIGLHEGPCLAVTLNERLDYFGQTVNIASRVQDLADARTICTTESVVRNERAHRMLEGSRLMPVPRRASLKGLSGEVLVYDIRVE
jgi:class 3 adenylate cyclase